MILVGLFFVGVSTSSYALDYKYCDYLFTLHGFAKNQTAVFTADPEQFGSNDLAMCRNTLQLEGNLILSDKVNIFVIGRFIWEPNYKNEPDDIHNWYYKKNQMLREAYGLESSKLFGENRSNSGC